jgi:hypothetical protein
MTGSFWFVDPTKLRVPVPSRQILLGVGNHPQPLEPCTFSHSYFIESHALDVTNIIT